MKFLLTLALCLIGLVANAATPAFSSFYGSNGVTVLTNPVTGKVIIVGSGGAATNAQPPSSVLTNIASNVSVVSQCYTSSYLNTNILVTTGFGTAGANGIYNWNGTDRFTNGAYSIRNDSGYGGWILTNTASGVLYDSFSEPAIGTIRTWDDVVGGAGPAGQDFFGPITNCFTNMTAINGQTFSLGPDSTNYYVNSFIGNDTNAIAGDPYHPWRSISGVLRVLPRDCTVYVTSAGEHALSSDGATAILTNGCRLVGMGPGVTFVGTAQGSEDSLFLLSDTTLSGITMRGKVAVGCGQQFTTGFSVEATNVNIYRCEVYGAADGLGLDTFRNFRAFDSEFYGIYDGVANWDNRGLDKTAYFRNCNITSIKTNLVYDAIHGISWLGGTLIMDGGSITVSNGTSQNTCIYVPASTNAPSKFFLNGVRFTHSTTNGNSTVTMFSNASQALITGTALIEDEPMHMSVSTMTNGFHHHIVGVTNANSTHTGGRTNYLPNTTAMGTNGFLRGKYTGRWYDKTFTASGTNIWLVTQGNQKINGGPVQTNIVNDGGSLTLSVGGIGGTNWIIEAAYP